MPRIPIYNQPVVQAKAMPAPQLAYQQIDAPKGAFDSGGSAMVSGGEKLMSAADKLQAHAVKMQIEDDETAAREADNYVINRMNDKPTDDRISLSPVASAIERGAGALVTVPQAVFGDGDKSRAVGDFLTAIGMGTGVPTGFITKPLSYAVDVAEGDSRPRHPGNVVSGVLTGQDRTGRR